MPSAGRVSSSGISALGVGPSIGAFSHKQVLHQGRYSTVWSARDSAGATVVIKAYYKLKMKARHARHVVRETRLLQILRDAGCGGVVRLDHAFEDDTCVYLVFDPCMKGDLYQLMTKHKGQLQEAFVATQIIAPLLSTLTLLHQLNIVHRDIKTENIFIASSGEVQLGDFGLVVHNVHDALVDRVGTLDYMAPEVLAMPEVAQPADDCRDLGPAPASLSLYNEKVDVWAVGVLLYELLVGKPPFEVEDVAETQARILAGEIGPVPDHVPADCADFIRTALTTDPAARPGAAQLRGHAWLTRHAARTSASQQQHIVTLRTLSAGEVVALRTRIDRAWEIDARERSQSSAACAQAAKAGKVEGSHKDGAIPTAAAFVQPQAMLPAQRASLPPRGELSARSAASEPCVSAPRLSALSMLDKAPTPPGTEHSSSVSSTRSSPPTGASSRSIASCLSGSFKVLGQDLMSAVSAHSRAATAVFRGAGGGGDATTASAAGGCFGGGAAASSLLPSSDDRGRLRNSEDWSMGGAQAGSLGCASGGSYTTPNTPLRPIAAGLASGGASGGGGGGAAAGALFGAAAVGGSFTGGSDSSKLAQQVWQRAVPQTSATSTPARRSRFAS